MSDPQAHREGPWRRWRMDELRPPRHARAAEAEAAGGQEPQQRRAQEQQAELEALREQARADARDEGYRAGFEAGRQEGHAEGLAEGRQTGERLAAERTDQMLAPLRPLAEAFREALARLDDEIAQGLVDLALATGHQLAGAALEAKPSQVLEIVRELLHVEPALSGQPRLWLHPDDLALVEPCLGSELAAAGWALQPDDQLSRGGCRITSASGELDASWESRSQAIADQVRRRQTPVADESPESSP